MKIDFIKPNIAEDDIKRMCCSIRTGWLATGSNCKEVEKRLAKLLGKKYAKLTNSCTTAIHAALIMAGVKEGDEVITTPLSWVATANTILYLRAKPVFVDVDSTGCLDPLKVKKAITKRTKAILVVNLYGQLADIEALRKFKLPIIEDAAHSPFSYAGGGDYTCLSFHAAKNLTCGNGGAIISNKPIDERLFYHGVERVGGKRVMTGWGYKGELTDFQAALLLGQLDRIEYDLLKRRNVFQRYEEAFYGKISYPDQLRFSAYHLFVIFVKNRDKVRKNLKGIETSIHYPAIHLEPYYQNIGFKKGSFPIAEGMGGGVIALPTYPQLKKEEQDYIIKEVLKCVLH